MKFSEVIRKTLKGMGGSACCAERNRRIVEEEGKSKKPKRKGVKREPKNYGFGVDINTSKSDLPPAGRVWVGIVTTPNHAVLPVLASGSLTTLQNELKLRQESHKTGNIMGTSFNYKRYNVTSVEFLKTKKKRLTLNNEGE